MDTFSDQAEYAPAETAAPPFPGDVKKGDKGPKVKVWQQMLKQRVTNASLKIDGVYGKDTFRYAMWWQVKRPHSRPVMDRALPAGFMGPHMWHSLVMNVMYGEDDSEEFDPDQPIEELLTPPIPSDN
jgi:hypothetical protein